jgi:hypothetical protein
MKMLRFKSRNFSAFLCVILSIVSFSARQVNGVQNFLDFNVNSYFSFDSSKYSFNNQPNVVSAPLSPQQQQSNANYLGFYENSAGLNSVSQSGPIQPQLPDDLAVQSQFVEINPNQIIIFNIGDTQQLENISSSFKQRFDQENINYCNFDPFLFASKRRKTPQSLLLPSGDQQRAQKNTDFNLNIFLKGDSFNESSQITVRLQFMNNLTQSTQLWYLLEAKSACTNQVVGAWKLTQQLTMDTIYCYDPEDVSLPNYYLAILLKSSGFSI